MLVTWPLPWSETPLTMPDLGGNDIREAGASALRAALLDQLYDVNGVDDILKGYQRLCVARKQQVMLQSFFHCTAHVPA